LPPTILSRCQRFDLRRIPTALIVDHLKTIATQEKVQIDEAALYAIGRGADGGMRDAECTLDQLISFCGNKIEEPDVLSMFGLTAQSQILALAEAVLNGETETALREFNDLAKGGKDLARLLSDLLNHFRNLLIYQVSKGDLKLLEVSESEAATLAKQSALASTDGLTRVMEVFTDGESRLRDAASKKILIEVTLLKAIESRNAVSIDTVLKQLQQLRSGTAPMASTQVAAPTRSPVAAPSVAAAPAPTPAMKPKAAAAVSEVQSAPAPVAPAAHAGGAVDLNTLWPQVLEAVGRVSAFTKSYLVEAHPVSLVKNVLTIGFDPEYADHLGMVDNSKNHALLQTKLHELGYGTCQIKFIQAEAPANWARPAEAVAPAAPAITTPAKSPTATPPWESPATPAVAAPPAQAAKPKLESVPFNKDDFKNDPLIQKALEIFKGQIVDVRA
ncbi:MAG: polymerase subunit gamma/tau, partial [Verrucomicrobiales bacterium]|nr:polymerase subunit gamma/tau [Verrucomicrobiales bacterium]